MRSHRADGNYRAIFHRPIDHSNRRYGAETFNSIYLKRASWLPWRISNYRTGIFSSILEAILASCFSISFGCVGLASTTCLIPNGQRKSNENFVCTNFAFVRTNYCRHGKHDQCACLCVCSSGVAHRHHRRIAITINKRARSTVPCQAQKK